MIYWSRDLSWTCQLLRHLPYSTLKYKSHIKPKETLTSLPQSHRNFAQQKFQRAEQPDYSLRAGTRFTPWIKKKIINTFTAAEKARTARIFRAAYSRFRSSSAYLHSGQVHPDRTGGIECLIHDTVEAREWDAEHRGDARANKEEYRARERRVAIDGTGWRVCWANYCKARRLRAPLHTNGINARGHQSTWPLPHHGNFPLSPLAARAAPSSSLGVSPPPRKACLIFAGAVIPFCNSPGIPSFLTPCHPPSPSVFSAVSLSRLYHTARPVEPSLRDMDTPKLIGEENDAPGYCRLSGYALQTRREALTAGDILAEQLPNGNRLFLSLSLLKRVRI